MRARAATLGRSWRIWVRRVHLWLGLTLGLHVATFGTAVVGSLLVSLISAVVVGFIGSGKDG